MVEGVAMFRYLVRIIYQTDDDWPAVRQNIMYASLVCGRLGTLLQLEGSYPRVEAMLYMAGVQSILLYGLDTWFLLVAIDNKLEGSHTGFLIQIMGDSVLDSYEEQEF